MCRVHQHLWPMQIDACVPYVVQKHVLLHCMNEAMESEGLGGDLGGYEKDTSIESEQERERERERENN